MTYAGDDDPRPERVYRTRWVEVCVCGHLATGHAPSIGGAYRLPGSEETTVRYGAGLKALRMVWSMDGCAGEMRSRSREKFTDKTTVADGVTVTARHVNVTCPCDEFRPVARVDRPHRHFHPGRPLDRTDPTRHPLVVAMRAYRKGIGKLKRAHLSPTGEQW